jgi:small subunit ribosomal protein S33
MVELQTKCRLFAHTFNPENRRLGNKVLRQRLRGPALAAYYPRRTVTIRDLQDAFKPHDLEIVNDAELDRLESLEKYGYPVFPSGCLFGVVELTFGNTERKRVERVPRRRSVHHQV